MSEETSSVNADGIFEPFHIDRVPWQEAFRGERFGLRFQHLSRFGGGSQVGVAMEVLPPGAGRPTRRITTCWKKNTSSSSKAT